LKQKANEMFWPLPVNLQAANIDQNSSILRRKVATAAFPTFAVLIGILINNQRLNDFAHAGDVRFSDTNRRIDETHRHIDDVKEILRGEMFRIEQVLDARLKHLC
jgi:hypothetical protein